MIAALSYQGFSQKATVLREVHRLRDSPPVFRPLVARSGRLFLRREPGDDVHQLVICSPDPGPKGMLDFYARIGIREGAEDEEESFHGGPGRLRPAAGGVGHPSG